MQLYIVRHGIAIDREDPKSPLEAERYLTDEGIERTRQVAKGIAALGVHADLMISSPYVRATQTAAIFAGALDYPEHKIRHTENLLPGFVPPSDMLNIAGIGVGGMGRANLINLASQNIVALCDVDWGYAGKSLDRLDTDIERLRARIDAPPAEPVPGQPSAEFNREKAKSQLADMIKLKTEHVPKAKRYKDYRQMLEQQKDIDAVVVA